MSDNSHEEDHTGPIKNPKQLLVAVFFSFVVPVFAIIGLVYYVTSAAKPAGSPDAAAMSLGGLSEDDRARGVAQRIQKVGMVEIRDANRALKSGEEVYKAQCTACQQGQHRAQAFAAGGYDVLGHLADQDNIGMQTGADSLIDGVHVVGGKRAKERSG